ncbi:MAG TPA: hypothetical protein VJ997_04155, partial [Longimicrobiales bacterium]|nr:hypothetical protein [Longimicrobiales bacterium]
RATAQAVKALVPFDEALLDGLALEVRRSAAQAVLCDIAPMGVAVAQRAGVPSILVENFTWPWLYEPLFDRAPGLERLAEGLDDWFDRATLHLLAQPYCRDDPRADGVVLPVSRPAFRTREEVRAALGIEPDAKVVVLTMGGVPEALPFLPELATLPHVTFLVTGAARTGVEGNVHLFDNATHLYMPHLVRAADAVVAKLGYSTVAEVWREGRPLAFVTRADFRETAPLRDWVLGAMPGFEIPGEDFAGGTWIRGIHALLEMDPPAPRPVGGADEVAGYLRRWLSNRS